MMARIGQATRYRRRASAYLIVLGSAMIVAVIGLSSLMVARIHHRTAEDAAIGNDARLYARSAVEAAIGASAVVSNWRSSGYSSGDPVGPFVIGRGTCGYTLVDETDGDLADDPDQPVRITGAGQVDAAVYYYSVLAEPPALNCLQTAIHAVGGFTVESGAVLTVNGGPAFCSYHDSFGMGRFLNNLGATVNGDVQADLVTNLGTITGTVIENAASRELPTSATIDYYRDRATWIDWSSISGGVIGQVILSHTNNPFGEVDPDGLYHIDTEGNDLQIEDCRIEGTLVVDVGFGSVLTVGGGIYWEPHRSDYPALIVNGDCEIGIAYPLSEPDTGVNFNPPGLPYNGEEDTDTDDVYPGVIKGLVHIAGLGSTVTLTASTQIEGALIAEGTITAQGTPTITHNPNLVLNPPKRYRATRLNVLPGTWRRELNP